MALQLAPPQIHRSQITNLTQIPTLPNSGAPSAPGIHDTLRANLTPLVSIPSTTSSSSSAVPTAIIISSHPLETRLAHWRSTQNALKMNTLRRTFGIAEPVRRGMELKIARHGEWVPGALGGSAGVSGDVLEGRDWGIEWEDVFAGDQTRDGVDFHAEMEARLKMNW